MMQRLLGEVDRPPVLRPEEEPCRVRIVWFVGLEPGVKEDAPPPPDLGDVIEELSAIGVTNLHLGAQTIVQAITNEEFEVAAETDPIWGGPNRLEFSGELGDTVGTARRLTVDLKIEDSEQGEVVCRLTTSLVAPIGHAVVLGVAPMVQRRSSVLVLQIMQ
jgi:hypothetical protein